MTWVFIEYARTSKLSAFAFCSGAIAGLVAITPAAGFVPIWSAPIFGFITAMSCAGFIAKKHRLGFDDALDSFGLHGVGGIVGNLLTGIFASSQIAALDGTVIVGGWLDGNFSMILIQLAACCAGFAWSFFMTLLILFIMNKLPYLNLRLTSEKEELGLDKSQMGECAYDYIEIAVQPTLTIDPTDPLMGGIKAFNNKVIPSSDSQDTKLNMSEQQQCQTQEGDISMEALKPSAP